MVKTFGDQFLACSSLTNDEKGAIERRGPAGALNRVKKSQALADELFCPLHAPTVGGKSHHLARIFTRDRRSKMEISLTPAIFDKMAQLLYG